jgi:hypothetical protein
VQKLEGVQEIKRDEGKYRLGLKQGRVRAVMEAAGGPGPCEKVAEISRLLLGTARQWESSLNAPNFSGNYVIVCGS